jgi:hypothetical protein
MGFDDSAEDIRRRMEQLRRELSCDAREVSRSARVMTDWRFYVRRFPCATVALTAAGGYLLIPKKKEVQVISPDPNALAEMFKKEQLRVETPARSKETQGLAKTLLLMGITWAAKTGMNYVGERFRTAAIHKAHEPSGAAPAVFSSRPQTGPK